MTDTSDFARRAEADLHRARIISPSTCAAWESLPAEAKAALAPALAFVGCQAREADRTPGQATREPDRVAAVRLMLVKLGLDGDDPRWSSAVLKDFLSAVMGISGDSVGALFAALYGVLGDYAVALSDPVAHFIKDVVVQCFTRYRQSYESVDWPQFVRNIGAGATKAQLYLALHAVPPPFVSSQLADAIARELGTTAYREEVVSALAV